VQDFSLHILDLVENSINAKAKRIEIQIDEDEGNDLLTIEISDNGAGMSEEMVAKVLDPFVTTRTTRKVGLGLSLFSQAAQECDGNATIRSELGKGTQLKGTFRLSHIDLKPWGSMVETILTLVIGNPEIDFFYQHRKGAFEYTLDSAVIKRELDGVSLSNPDVVTLLRNDLKENLNEIGID
jgi:hypothetical protein